jgi:hypothetical protein
MWDRIVERDSGRPNGYEGPSCGNQPAVLVPAEGHREVARSRVADEAVPGTEPVADLRIACSAGADRPQLLATRR